MRTLVVAPHPDDEILGCGGTLLRRKAESGELGWLIVTGIIAGTNWPAEAVERRKFEITRVTELMGFGYVYNAHLPTSELDTVPIVNLIEHFAAAFKAFQPEEVLVPHRGDAHTDHRIVSDAATACTKWFRYPSIGRVLAYETPSETDFGLNREFAFMPNYFVNISEFLARKLEVMAVYKSELGAFPFPRSIDAIKALAMVRGAASGFLAAEAFQLLRERY